MIYEILLDRLVECFGAGPCDEDDIWGVGFYPSMIDEGTSLEPSCYTPDGHNAPRKWTAETHAARIRYLMQSPEDLEAPISLDCICGGGRVYAIPVILDGWHRYFAHHALKRKTIRAGFGGRVDLLEYLTGESDERPTDF